MPAREAALASRRKRQSAPAVGAAGAACSLRGAATRHPLYRTAEEWKRCAPFGGSGSPSRRSDFADSCTLSTSKGALLLLVDGSDLSLRFRGLLFANGDRE